MIESDLAAGMRLKEEAGWNQSMADWRRALSLEPPGCFVAEQDGQVVGTVTSCSFGGGTSHSVAWIAMMLVAPSMRGQGIGRALMTRALEYLDGAGIRSVRLDATPAGQPLYEKLGFKWEYTLTRYAGRLPRADAVSQVQTYDDAALEPICRLDQAVTGTDRRKLLERLLDENRREVRLVRRDGELLGFLLSRTGANARHIGPCHALDDAGELLLADAFYRYQSQPVYFDVPQVAVAAIAAVERQGLSPQRPLARMCRGPSVGELPQHIWATFGPEKG